MKSIYATKQRIIQAFEDIDFNYLQKLIGYDKEWAVWYASEKENWSEDMKESIAIVTGFITTLKRRYFCLLNPWTIAVDNTRIDDAFQGSFIKESWKESEKVAKKSSSNTAIGEYICKKKYEYIYLLASKMLNIPDEIYLYLGCDLNRYPYLVDDKLSGESLYLRFNGLSLRGSRRIKIWDTFVTSPSSLSRSAKPGKFSQLSPEWLALLDDYKTDEDKCTLTLFDDRMIPAIHPHIGDGRPCLGAWENRLSNAASLGFADVFFKSIRAYLNTWTPSSPYWNINDGNSRFTINDKNINFTSVDHIYITQRYSRLLYGGILLDVNNAKRIMCTEKLDKGYISKTTLDTLDRIVGINEPMFSDGYLISKILGLKYGASDTASHIDMIKINPYYIFEKMLEEKGTFYVGKQAVPLIGKMHLVDGFAYDPYSLLRSLLLMAQQTVRTRTEESLANMDYKEIQKWNYREIIAKVTIEDIENGFKKIAAPLADTKAKEDSLNLKLTALKDVDFLSNILLKWIKLSIEKSILVINTKKKELNNELINITQDSQQSELFS